MFEQPAPLQAPVRPDVPTQTWRGEVRDKEPSLLEIEPDDSPTPVEELALEEDEPVTAELEPELEPERTAELAAEPELEPELEPLDDDAVDTHEANVRVMTADNVDAFAEEEAVSSELLHAGADSHQAFALESPDLDSQERFAVSAYDPDPASTSSLSVRVPERSSPPPAVAKPRSIRPPAVFDADQAQRLRDEGNPRALFALHSTFGKRPDAAQADRAEHRTLAAKIALDELAEPETALVEALGALEDGPTHPEASVMALRLLAEVGARAKLNEASRRLERRLDEHEPKERAALRAVLARIALEQKRKDQAREHISELGRLDPAHPLVLEQRANEARAAGDFQTQRKLLLESLDRFERKDDRLRVLLELAELHAGPINTPKRASEYFRSALEEDQDSLPALRGLERLARQQNDAVTLIEMLERQVAILPKGKEQYDTRLRVAEECEKSKRFEDALLLLEPVFESDAHRARALAISERCKAQTGDTRGVAQALIARAHLQQSPKAKVELLWQAAQAQEVDLRDLDGAVDTLRLLVATDDKNLKGFVELERVLLLCGRVEEAVDSGIQVANLTKDKSEAAAKFVILGETLLRDLSDRLSAKLQFEKALECDKKNLAALTHLERMAAETGDKGRADVLLERRASLEPDATAAAELFVQLASMREDGGDEPGRVQALEQALVRNPDHADVVRALLDTYVRTSKLDKALALSEQTIAIESAQRNATAELARRRERTQLLVGLNRTKEALQCAFATHERFGTDSAARDDVLQVGPTLDKGELPKFRTQIAAFYDTNAPTRAESLLRLAQMLEPAGEPLRAREALERVVSWNHTTPEVWAHLENVLTALGAHERLAEVKIEHAKHLAGDERFAKLLQAGDLYARTLGVLDRAIRVFEQALPQKPEDPWLRETLAWAYEEVQDYRKLAAVLRKDVTLAPTAERRGEILEELAGIVETHLGAPEEASQILEERLDDAPDALHVFERIVRGHTERKDWIGLERSYRRMLDRIRTSTDNNALRMTLWKQLVVLCRDRLQDDAKALDAAYAARSIDERDKEVRGMIHELAIRTSRPDLEVSTLREWVKDEPLEPKHYVALYEHFLREQAFDKAWSALDVLSQLVPLTPTHAEYYDDYPPYAPDAIGGSVTEEAWASHLLHADLDPLLTRVFQHLTAAQLRIEGRIDSDPIPYSPSHSMAFEQITAVLANSAEVLGIPAPPLFVTDRGAPFQLRIAPHGAWSVAPSAGELHEALTFCAAMFLCYQRADLRSQAFFPQHEAYANLLVRAAQGDPGLFSAMDPISAREVRDLLAQAANEGRKFDVKRWFIAQHTSTARAGLLISGSAHGAAIYYSEATSDPLAAEKLGELYCFAVSDEYAELRVAIGVAVGSDQQ
jgi:tetratricopeptide (TPR) repeat protein